MIDPTIIAIAIRALVDFYLNKGKTKKQSHRLSRAVGDFGSRNKAFCKELKDVQSVIDRYIKRNNHHRPLNILLSASPGGGKSFLARQLAKACGGSNAPFHEIYIPTLTAANKLDAAFSRFSKTNRVKDSIPFVLFDEMDVEIGEQHLYGNFLGPIWDGKVDDNGSCEELTPAVFLFAGSAAFPALSNQGIQNLARFEQKPISYEAYRNNWIRELEQRIDGDSAPKKLKDFVDRMDLFVCIPPTNSVLMSETEVMWELMDVVCIIVKKYFKKVVEIEFSAMACLIQELKYHPSRRVLESIMQCASCAENDTQFLFDHLTETVKRRYANETEVSKGKGIIIEFS